MDIEAADSYIKRPAGPMVTIEVQDITRLAGFIMIPSMAEGAPNSNTIRQRILYSGLPNQCRKCRRFGHHARACNTNIARAREDSRQPNPPTRCELRGGPKRAIKGTSGGKRKQSNAAHKSPIEPSRKEEGENEDGSAGDLGTPPSSPTTSQPGQSPNWQLSSSPPPKEAN